MITTAPRLRIRRPSPTTAEFTVTTLPPSTLRLRILRTSLLVLRLVLTLATLLLLHGRWATRPLAAPDHPPDVPPPPPPPPVSLGLALDTAWLALALDTAWLALALGRYQRSRPGAFFARAASSLPAGVLAAGCLAALYLVGRRVHSHESLLVLRGLGVQTTESPATYLAGPATRFIPTEKIQDIFVNEAFRGFEVRYYLVVVVEGEEDLVVVFPGLLPRRKIVETVWRGVRECLYENAGE